MAKGTLSDQLLNLGLINKKQHQVNQIQPDESYVRLCDLKKSAEFAIEAKKRFKKVSPNDAKSIARELVQEVQRFKSAKHGKKLIRALVIIKKKINQQGLPDGKQRDRLLKGLEPHHFE